MGITIIKVKIKMRRIQKEISLEPMTSRVPSILPAYKDNVLYYFDDASLRSREYLYPSNYGMVPVNLIVSPTPNSGHTYSEYNITKGCHCYGSSERAYDELCDFVLSFERLSKWYHFFTEYYRLLNDYGHCGMVYSSATEYYDHESQKRYMDQLAYGSDRETYENLDERFADMGGRVNISELSGGTAMDEGFFKWICDEIIPSYKISNDYSDYWKTSRLFYPDVIKWMAWLSERLDYESVYSPPEYDGNGNMTKPESWDCKSYSGDCCDCEEYFRRGGERELRKMKDWYARVQDSLGKMNSVIAGNEDYFIPTIISPMELQTSIDDLGQYSIFSKEYQEGTDYRVARYGDNVNSYSGTVVTVDGKPMILTRNAPGFCYDPYYLEKHYSEGDWSDYTERFISENPDMFLSSAYTYYSFARDDSKVTSDADSLENARAQIDDAVKTHHPATVSDYGWVLVNGTLCPIQAREYGKVFNPITKNHDVYYVERDRYTDTPFIYVKNSKVYGEWDEKKAGYAFEAFKPEAPTKYYPRRFDGASDDDLVKYVVYDGVTYELNERTVTEYETEEGSGLTGYMVEIDSYVCPIIEAYLDEDGIEFYAVSGNGNSIIPGDNVSDISIESVSYDHDGEEFVIDVETEPIIYSSREITGKTTSKIYGIRASRLLVDDVGNELECLVPGQRGYSHQPDEGADMEPVYQVGNTANVDRMKLTITDIDDAIGKEYNVFTGDIITDMVFYYRDTNGYVVENTVVSVGMIDGGYRITMPDGATEDLPWSATTSLRAILYAGSAKQGMSDEGSPDFVYFDEDIYCDVTYYKGATLSRKDGEAYRLAYDAIGPDGDGKIYSYGVRYDETVRFRRTNAEYYLKTPSDTTIPSQRNVPGNRSVSYPIYIYRLVQGAEEIPSSTYDTLYDTALADFKCEINLITRDGTTFSKYKDMDPYNGIRVLPVFKEEYLLGISSLENIDSDIYIERGINSAFEKHLKLGEVTSLETLEDYGLTYFKFMEN